MKVQLLMTTLLGLLSYLSIAPICPPNVVTNPYIGGRVFRDVDHNGVYNSTIDVAIEDALVSVYRV